MPGIEQVLLDTINKEKYFVKQGRKYVRTACFIGFDAKENIKNVNEYLAKHPEEGVIWSGDDDTIVVVARLDDLGIPL